MHILGPDSSAYLIGKAETDRWNFWGLVESRLISWCLNMNIEHPTTDSNRSTFCIGQRFWRTTLMCECLFVLHPTVTSDGYVL